MPRATAVGDDILVLIDQEGGRVRRLKPPHWRELPPAAAYGRLYAGDPRQALPAARLAARLTAADLRAVGINTNCAPVLDVPVAGSHDIIGDRAYGAEPRPGAAISGCAVAEGYMARRRAAGHQAHSRTWPGDQGQPSAICPWCRRRAPSWRAPILPRSGASPICRRR